jgi:hypothetical protein
MSYAPLPETSHDPAVFARPTVGPEGLSRPFPPKTLGFPAALGPQSMSHVPWSAAVCCTTVGHKCVVSTFGGLRRRVSGVGVSTFLLGGVASSRRWAVCYTGSVYTT